MYRWAAVLVTVAAVVGVGASFWKWRVAKEQAPFDGIICRVEATRLKKRLLRDDPFAFKYVVNVGSGGGVKEDDLFEVFERPSYFGSFGPNPSKDALGLLRVIGVSPEESECSLESTHYIGPKRPSRKHRVRLISRHEAVSHGNLKAIVAARFRALGAFTKADEPSTIENVDAVLARFTEFIAEHPESRWLSEAMMGKAALLRDCGRFDEAKQIYGSVERRFPLDAVADGARNASNEATLRSRIAADDQDAEAHFLLGQLLSRGSKYAEALPHLYTAKGLKEELLHIDDHIAMATWNFRCLYLFLGKEGLENGDYEWALTVFRKVDRYVKDDDEIKELIKTARKAILLDSPP